jgi:glutathione S-transferase
MYRLWIANKNYSSWSLRPWLMMRVLDIPFEEVLLPFGHTVEGKSLAQLSPSARVPFLEHEGLQIWDSLAIVEYLAERHPQVWPHASPARAYARSAAAEMHSGFAALRNVCGMNCGVRVHLHEVSAALHADMERLDRLWQDGLSRHAGPWLAGRRFSAVDTFFAPVAFRMQTYGLPFAATSQSYLQRLLDLPAMQSWYAAGIAETWRDAPHDQELQAVGTITQDLRA